MKSSVVHGAYLSLAKLGPSTVREIVMDSKLPRNKAYESLQRLEEQNKVMSLPISPKKYRITDSGIFKEEVMSLNQSVHSLIKMVEQPKIVEFKDFFWVIKGKKAIEQKLAIQNTNTKREILSCNRLSKIIYKNIRTMKESIDRGVNVKMICTFEKDKINSYRSWLSSGARIRVFNEKKFGPLLPRISVMDGEIARMTIGRPEVEKEEDYLTLWTESKAFAQMLKNHFMNMWKHSDPIEKYLRN